jgi:hypothetical protein
MSATVSPGMVDLYVALRAFIQGVIGGTPPVPVIQGLGNRAAMPAGPFIAMTRVGSYRLATNVDTDTDGYPSNPQITSALQATRLDIQIDFYGPNSGDWATMIGTLFRDPYASDALGDICQPLYADDPRMMPLITAEKQYLERWMVLAALAYNPVTVTPQAFFTTLDIVPINVDVRIPP